MLIDPYHFHPVSSLKALLALEGTKGPMLKEMLLSPFERHLEISLKEWLHFFEVAPQKTGVFLVETKILRSIPPETNMVSEKRPPGKGDSYSKPSF